MARPVRVELRHQRRALAGVALADRLELGEPRARREPDLAVGEDVRPRDAADDGRGEHCGLDPAAGHRQSARGRQGE